MVMIDPDKLFGRLGNRLFQMAYIISKKLNGEIEDIYVQDYELFEDCEPFLKQAFGQEIYPVDKVAIHVRRGDYINHPDMVDLWETSYYEKAIEKFPDSEFLVFSDDPEWCEDNFLGVKYEICTETDPVKSLNLMAGCKHQIIANSSFSWWGAYLNPNPNKIVIAPKEWFKNKLSIKTPPSWLRI